MEILGSRITDYLLEVTRVCSQSEGEGNYHIFYQLLSSEIKSKYHLTEPQEYTILSNRNRKAGDIDDGKEFKALELSFMKLGFPMKEHDDIWRMVAAILHLGNTSFRPLAGAGNIEGSEIEKREPLQRAAELLGVDSTALEKCMTHKQF